MRVLLTGAHGMLGSSIRAHWDTQAAGELIPVGRDDADLREAAEVRRLFERIRPDAVIHAAARVGGIADKLAHPAGYLRDNVAIDAAVLGAALDTDVTDLLYIGSAAVYPQHTAQPIAESALLSGALEAPNEPYSIAKIAGAKLCEYVSRERGYAYRVAVPSNLYGVDDRFDPESAHLVAAALAKVHAAQHSGAPAVSVWGDGTARREFTFAGDLAQWIVAQVGRLREWPPMLNLGVGDDHSIAEYYETAAEIVGFTGALEFDVSKPAGVAQRLLDSTAARQLGWNPSTSLGDGMRATYDRYLMKGPHS